MIILGHVEYVIGRSNFRQFRKNLRQRLGGGYSVGGVRVTHETPKNIRNTEYLEVTVRTSCLGYGVKVRILAYDVYLHAFMQLSNPGEIWHKLKATDIDVKMPGGVKLPFTDNYKDIGNFTDFTFSRNTLENAIISLDNINNVAQPNIWKTPLFCLALFLCEACRLPEIDHVLYRMVEENHTVHPDEIRTWQVKVKNWSKQCKLYVNEVEAVEGIDFLKRVDPKEDYTDIFLREEEEDDAGSGSSGRTVGDILDDLSPENLELRGSLGLILRSVVDSVMIEAKEKEKDRQKKNKQKKRQ